MKISMPHLQRLLLQLTCALTAISLQTSGVITDVEILKKDGVTVCLLGDDYVDTMNHRLRSHTDKGSFYRPLLHLDSNNGIEASIEHECIVQHQREALKKLIMCATQEHSVRILIEDQTSPLPAGYSVDATPQLCYGHVKFASCLSVAPATPETLCGLPAFLRSCPETCAIPTHNVDMRGALEGILPLYSARSVLRKLLWTPTTPMQYLQLSVATKQQLEALSNTERVNHWCQALDELSTLTHLQTPGEAINQIATRFTSEETAILHHKISRIAPTLPRLTELFSRIWANRNGTHLLTEHRDILKRIATAVELLCASMARLPALQMITTILSETPGTTEKPKIIFCGLSGPHAINLCQQLQEKFGFRVDPCHTQRIKTNTLHELFAPAARLHNPGTFETWHAKIQTNPVTQKWLAL